MQMLAITWVFTKFLTLHSCWISTDVNGVIWFFVGPMLAVILVRGSLMSDSKGYQLHSESLHGAYKNDTFSALL